MLKTSIEPPHFWNHTGKFIILTNLITLFYGITSDFGLAYILAAYLIESVLIGFFTVLVLLKKVAVTKQIWSGIGSISLFTSAYFSWLLVFAILPMLLMGFTPTEYIENFLTGFEAVLIEVGIDTPNILSVYGLLIAAYISSVLNFFITYHWPALIGLAVIYGYEFLKEKPSDRVLQERSFATLLLRPFWRLMFLLYGPYFIGLIFYMHFYEDNSGPIPWLTNALLVTLIIFVKFSLDLNRHRRAIQRSSPTPIRRVQPVLKPGPMERNDRQLNISLEDTFTY
jgi:hypothetical protein